MRVRRERCWGAMEPLGMEEEEASAVFLFPFVGLCAREDAIESMATFVPVENVMQVELVFRWNDQIVENVFHVRNPGEVSVDDETEVASTFKTWWTDFWQTGAGDEVSLEKIRVRDLTLEAGFAIEYTSGLPLEGESVDAPSVPNNVTLAIKWLTGLAGRSFRGRTYHVGIPASLVTANVISSGSATYFEESYGSLQTMIEADARFLVVVSRVQGGVTLGAGVATNIIGCSVDRTIDSQRRRLPGRGS